MANDLCMGGLSLANEEEDSCWICMAGASPEQPLESPCACPRRVHLRCLARWQLQQAGRREETHCRFCHAAYGDWRQSLAPRCDAADVPPRPATPIMAISFEGAVHYIKVYPGAEGRARFEAQIRELIRLEEGEDFDVEFECKAPDTGATLHLDGIDAFDAATHCAALTAAERISKQQQQAAEAAQAEQPAAASAEPQQQAFDAAATQLPSGGDAASCPGAAGGPAPMGVQQ